MRKKISLVILGYTGSTIKQVTASKALVRFLCVVLAGFLSAVGYLGYDYVRIRSELGNLAVLENEISDQGDELENQRKQIKRFANKINLMTANLADLGKLEKKIRIIAGIDPDKEQDVLFGVGGSAPADLDARISLKQQHGSLIREMSGQLDHINQAAEYQKESFKSLLEKLEEQINFLAATPSIRPTNGWVTSKFGYRKSPFTGLREFHKALDIATLFKSPVIAPANGKITFIGTKGGLGKMVIIDHGHGIITRYGHLNKALKKRGEKVKRGDVIGLVGRTGRVTGSHLHYEVLLNGIAVNPKKYILN